MSSEPPVCVVCGDEASNRCGFCHQRSYCSRTCQRSHWASGHRQECPRLRTQTAHAATSTATSAAPADPVPTPGTDSPIMPPSDPNVLLRLIRQFLTQRVGTAPFPQHTGSSASACPTIPDELQEYVRTVASSMALSPDHRADSDAEPASDAHHSDAASGEESVVESSEGSDFDSDDESEQESEESHSSAASDLPHRRLPLGVSASLADTAVLRRLQQLQLNKTASFVQLLKDDKSPCAKRRRNMDCCSSSSIEMPFDHTPSAETMLALIKQAESDPSQAPSQYCVRQCLLADACCQQSARIASGPRRIALSSLIKREAPCTPVARRQPRNSNEWPTAEPKLPHVDFGDSKSIGWSSSQCRSLQTKMVPKVLSARQRLNSRAFCGRFSPNGRYFAVAEQEGTISLLDSESWEVCRQIEAGDVGWSIMDIDFSSDGRHMLFATSQNVQIASIDDNEAQTTVDIEEVTAFGARFAPNGTDVLFGCRNGHLILFDTQARTLLMHAPDAHQDDINAVSFVGDSSFVFASASDDSLCKLWDTRASTSRSQGGFIGHTRGLTSVSADTSNLLLTNGKDHTARLWDIRRLASVSAMQTHVSDNAADLARFDYRFNWRNGRAAAPTRPHNSRRVADQSLHTFVGHSVAQTLIRANFSPASTGHAYVYSGSSSGDIFVWSTLSGELVDVLNGCHQAIVRECHWHPRLPMMGTASWDGNSAKLAFQL